MYTKNNNSTKQVENVLIPHGLIIDRIEKISQDIRADTGPEPVHFLCVLKGGEQFFSDLLQVVKRLHRYNEDTSVFYTMDFIRVSSYANDGSSGHVTITGGDVRSFKGRNIVIVEDIIDTGLTMRKLVEEVKKYNPKSVRVAALLVKRRKVEEPGPDGLTGYKPDYAGFSIPDYFVVGYCLDYNEFFRDMDHICIINDAGKERFKLTARTP